MSPVFRFHPGESPLLISVPHDGRELPADISERMTERGRALPDTDWHVAELYRFARDLGASVVTANFSRYVVDLNRSADDKPLYAGQVATGLCPEQTFGGDSLYAMGSVSEDEKQQRIAGYWQPYHQQIVETLGALKAKHGYALLWDAHSIPGVVPRLFEGELPALNLGSNDGASCAAAIEDAVAQVARASPFSAVVNGRFKGGYITRQYGAPADGVHALQLEIAQRNYMDEKSLLFDAEKASLLRDTLSKMLQSFLSAADRM